MALNFNKALDKAKKGDVRLPTPGEIQGRPGAPGWSPAQTTQEIISDPYRAGRFGGFGGLPPGLSELMTGWEKTTGNKITGGWYPKAPKSGKDVIGQNPQIKQEEITGTPTAPTGPSDPNAPAPYSPLENIYADATKQALAASGRPDFAAAQATAANQANLAQALQGLYGTGSGALTGLIGNLQSQAQGDFGARGSLGQALLNQGLQQNIAGVRSQLASQRGLSPALAARYAAQQTAQLGGQTAQQAGILGLQQQIAAQEQLGKLGMGAAELGAGTAGQLLTQGRQQDITQATAATDADLKKLQILASSDVGMRDLQTKTGLSEKDLKFKIALANQAAAIGDRVLQGQIIGGLIAAIGQAGASAATPTPKANGGRITGSNTGISAGDPFEYSNRLAAHGGRIDGMALVEGDDYRNDIVHAKLSPGEIVIPRSAAKDKKKAKAFLDALDGWDEKPSYAKVLKARRGR